MNVKIVDSIMGSGKTTAIINMINNAGNDERFFVITPYKQSNDSMYVDNIENIFEPKEKSGNKKIVDLKRLVKRGVNIVTTHSMFNCLTDDILEIIEDKGYKLVIDECISIMSDVIVSKDDFNIIKESGCISIDEAGKVKWIKDEYNGDFEYIKRFADKDSLYYSNGVLMSLMPLKLLSCFSEIFVCTYMFEAQELRYYFEMNDIKYDYYSIENNCIVKCNDNKPRVVKKNYRELINLIDNDKLNNIGDFGTLETKYRRTALTSSWYKKQRELLKSDKKSDRDKCEFDKLRKNLITFFKARCNSTGSGDRLWACYQLCEEDGFSSIVDAIGDKGFRAKRDKKDASYFKKTSTFISANVRGTNDYMDRKNIAYLVDMNMSPFISVFFKGKGIYVDKNKYSLSEMLQFIFRGAIRNDKPINLYVPSKRMRNLLKDWIDENSL